LFSRSRTTSQIQGARAGGLDLKDLLLLPSSYPSLPRLNVLITLGKRANNRFTDSLPFYFASLSLRWIRGRGNRVGTGWGSLVSVKKLPNVQEKMQ